MREDINQKLLEIVKKFQQHLIILSKVEYDIRELKKRVEKLENK